MRKLLIFFLTILAVRAADLRGRVTFATLPVPGVTVTATHDKTSAQTVTDADGKYILPGLAGGIWKTEIEIAGFAKQSADINTSDATPKLWELVMLPIADMHATIVKLPAQGATASASASALARTELKPAPGSTKSGNNPRKQDATAQQPPPGGLEATPPVDPDLNRRAQDGLLINGSQNNGAASPFSQTAAFGNNRGRGRSLYNGNIGITIDHSIFDARPYSLTGQDTAKPDFSRMAGLVAFGGPFRIPRLMKNKIGPMFFVNYQWTRNRNATTQPGLMPTAAERTGDFSQSAAKPIDPTTGQPFAGSLIPATRLSPQALALLNLFPLPNAAVGRYNFQTPLINNLHQDALQARAFKQIGRKNNVNGGFNMQSARTDTPNLFGFLDTGRTLGLNANLNWRRTFGPRFFVTLGVQYSRQNMRTDPFFSNRVNVSAAAGITGNLQDPQNWGPPSLTFANTTALSDATFSLERDQTTGFSYDTFWARGKHNLSYGADYRRQQFNALAQQNPRGAFTFTGLATGNDFAGFLLGIPDASALAYGNADKYFRSNTYDLYVSDDWRVRPGLTMNLGVRWDYTSPITELRGRLVNLDIANGFTSATPAIPGVIEPDRNNISPRFAFAWRPLPASSMVVRGGYGVYFDTSVYPPIANLMAQQAPLSTSIRASNTPSNPLTLASGFHDSAGATATTFAIDPKFQIGYAQNWQLAVQRDLPFALQIVTTYLGVKGTRAIQQSLPNTYPTGAVDPCAACPSGFSYLTSNGNSTRHSGMLQLRRRLRSGFASELAYTYAKAIDDAALGARGSYLIAQDWLNLAAERGRSNFDQRHVLSLLTTYTSGMGMKGGGLMTGWRAALLKEWTFVSQINASTGTPLTPVYLAAVGSTGVTGTIRPDYLGGPNLNVASYTAPAPGHWGDAGRNTITGPGQFSLNGSMSRTFRLTDRFSGDLRIDATNALNHPVVQSFNTVVTGSQFGLPTNVNAMRSIQTTFRVRF